MQVKVNLLGAQLAQQAKQVDQAASQSVHRPGGHHVDLTPGDGAQQLLHRRPLLARHAAADAVVVEHAGDDPAVLLRDGAQVADLVFGGLPVRGRAAGLEGDAFGHGRIMPEISPRNQVVPVRSGIRQMHR